MIREKVGVEMRLSIEEIRREMAYGRRLADMQLRVTAYVRVSTDHEEQKSSFKNQETYFTNKIKENPNWTYVPFYMDEAKTGTSVYRRSSFLRMIDDAKNDKFDMILTKEVSRFARDLLDSIQYSRELLKYNVGIFFEDLALNTIEPDSELRLAIMASIAQEESRKLSERVKFGYARGTERGVRHGPTAPIGYIFNNDNNGYSIDERSAYIVKYVFTEYARGEKGTRTIAAELAKQGYLNDAGNPYNPSTIKRMIGNPVYLGNIVNGKTKKPSYREPTRISQPKDAWSLCYDPQRVPPLIDQHTWDKANMVLADRGKILKGVDCSSKDALGGGKYTYSGRIVCEEHDAHYNRATSRWTVDGIEYQSEYWRCCLYKKYGRKQCDSPLIYTRDMNNIMREIFSSLQPVLNVECETIAKMIENVVAPDTVDNDIDTIITKRKTLEAKKDKLLEGWTAGIVSTVDYKKAVAKIEESIIALSEKEDDVKHIRNSMDVVAQTGKEISRALNDLSLESDSVVEEIVRCFVKKIIVKRLENTDNTYALEVWLFNSDTPIIKDLSLCAHTHRCPGRRTAPKAALPCADRAL